LEWKENPQGGGGDGRVFLQGIGWWDTGFSRGIKEEAHMEMWWRRCSRRGGRIVRLMAWGARVIHVYIRRRVQVRHRIALLARGTRVCGLPRTDFFVSIFVTDGTCCSCCLLSLCECSFFYLFALWRATDGACVCSSRHRSNVNDRYHDIVDGSNSKN